MARTTFWFSERIQFHQKDKHLLLNKPIYDKNAYLRIFLLALERYIYHIYYYEKGHPLPDTIKTTTRQKNNFILKLNFDIIMEIKRYLSPLDCFHLMLTCHEMWYHIGFCEPLLYQESPLIYNFAMKRNTPQFKPRNKKNINHYNIWYHGYESIEDSPNLSFTKSIITIPSLNQQQQQQPCIFLLNIYHLLLKEISNWIDNDYTHHRRYNVFPYGYNTASRCADIKGSIQIQDYFKIIGMSPMYDFILKIFNTKTRSKNRYDFEDGVGSFNRSEVQQIYTCLKKLQPYWNPFKEHLDLDDILIFFEDCLNDNIDFNISRFCISAAFKS
ncbi:unnamed protein product [Cunninghamella blakesleeana]